MSLRSRISFVRSQTGYRLGFHCCTMAALFLYKRVKWRFMYLGTSTQLISFTAEAHKSLIQLFCFSNSGGYRETNAGLRASRSSSIYTPQESRSYWTYNTKTENVTLKVYVVRIITKRFITHRFDIRVFIGTQLVKKFLF